MIEQVAQAILQVVAPVFLVAAIGFVYAGRRPLPIGAFTDLIIHLTGACLVFDALATGDRLPLSAIRAPASVCGIVLGSLGVGLLARAVIPSLRRLPVGAVLLPVGFMNTGNLGLPLMQLAYGEEGFEMAMLFFVTFSVLVYSLGVAIVKADGGLREVFRLPLVYAAVGGIVVNQMQVELPAPVRVPVHMLGQTVVPMMLLSLGGRMRSLLPKAGATRPPLAPAIILPLLRTGAGLAVGLGVNWLLENQGLVADVTLIVSLLPPAVMNFALVEKYGDSEDATAVVSMAISIGTGLSVFVLPVALAVLSSG